MPKKHKFQIAGCVFGGYNTVNVEVKKSTLSLRQFVLRDVQDLIGGGEPMPAGLPFSIPYAKTQYGINIIKVSDTKYIIDAEERLYSIEQI